MEKKQRLILVVASVENGEGKRTLRFKKEAEKLNLEVIVINSYKCKLTEKSIICEGNEVVLRKNDVCWCISNSMVNHYIAYHLQLKGIFVWPSIEAINFSDKFMTNTFFSNIGVDTPRTALVNSISKESIQEVAENVGGFPCVIKGNKGSMGKSVEIVNSEDDAIAFIKDIMSSVGKNSIPFKKISFQLQEFIAESVGEDFRIICLQGEIVGGVKRVAQDGFKANISLGGKAELFEVDEPLKCICKRIMEKGNIFYAGIDFIKSKRGYLAIEVNSSSQFQGFEERTKINVAREILKKITKN